MNLRTLIRYPSLFVLSLVLVAAIGCGGLAQMGADPAAFKAVDALYTAFGMHDLKLVDQCQKQIAELQTQEKIPPPAAAALASYIAEARGGKWESAQLKLSEFMEGQRREAPK